MIQINLRKIFSEILQIALEDITIETNTITCSQWDSITHNLLMTMIEAKSTMEIDSEMASEMLSVADILRILQNKGGFVPDDADQFLLRKEQ